MLTVSYCAALRWRNWNAGGHGGRNLRSAESNVQDHRGQDRWPQWPPARSVWPTVRDYSFLHVWVLCFCAPIKDVHFRGEWCRTASQPHMYEAKVSSHPKTTPLKTLVVCSSSAVLLLWLIQWCRLRRSLLVWTPTEATSSLIIFMAENFHTGDSDLKLCNAEASRLTRGGKTRRANQQHCVAFCSGFLF